MGILPIPRYHKAFKSKKSKKPLPTLPVVEGLGRLKKA